VIDMIDHLSFQNNSNNIIDAPLWSGVNLALIPLLDTHGDLRLSARWQPVFEI